MSLVAHLPDQEPQTRLLTLPYELRRAIYADLLPTKFHVFNERGKTRFSVCIEEGACDSRGFARLGEGRFDYENQTWARRLRSSWGPHWMCEEKRFTQGQVLTIALVCKTMYKHVATFMGDCAEFYLTDLDTLQSVLPSKGHQLSIPPCFFTQIFPVRKQLGLILRFPLGLCEAMDDPNPTSKPELHPHWASQFSTWLQISQVISQFKQLNSLKIWIDHDDKSSWSVVNERALLSPLLPLTHHMDISIQLPKSDPRYETFYRHYSRDGPAPPFSLDRVIRQDHHGVEQNGQLRVVHELGFPRFEYIEGVEDEELEELERRLWQARRASEVAAIVEVIGGYDTSQWNTGYF